MGLWKAWKTVPNFPSPNILPNTKSFIYPLYSETDSNFVLVKLPKFDEEVTEVMGFDSRYCSYFEEVFFFIYSFIDGYVLL